jgi:hypothetical protein
MMLSGRLEQNPHRRASPSPCASPVQQAPAAYRLGPLSVDRSPVPGIGGTADRAYYEGVPTAPRLGDSCGRAMPAAAANEQVVTVRNGAGSATVSSTLTEAVGGAIAAPTNVSLPTISGVPHAGATLVGSAGSWSGAPTSYAYQLRRCDAVGSACSDIAGMTSPAYGVQAVDVGSTLRLQVTALNAGGSRSALSVPTDVVTAAAIPPPPPPPASGVRSPWRYASSDWRRAPFPGPFRFVERQVR